ncbi:calcium-binding protein [Pseudaestuariivita rosea]|uniref:calcium-binding protein n=1 Tax=Pseudaestuariivita rosea TaxID=2763263 RepID=UPI001ABA650E|nr:calcium-binding protein [Pseudaestuariivita rosea]
MSSRSINGELSITAQELDFLDSILASGDRGGFYLTYGSMMAYKDDNGSSQLALQAKISTFSDPIGASAFLANRLVQEAFQTPATGFPETYDGIYKLSQDVAIAALSAATIDLELGGNGFINDDAVFDSTFIGWGDNVDYFPGNILASPFEQSIRVVNSVVSELVSIVVDEYNATGAVSRDSIIEWLRAPPSDPELSPGAKASALAGLAVIIDDDGSFGGKQISDYSGAGYDRLSLPYGASSPFDGPLDVIISNETGKVVAVDDSGILPSVQTGFEVALNAAIAAATLTRPFMGGVQGLIDSVLDQVFQRHTPTDWTQLDDPSPDDGDDQPSPVYTDVTHRMSSEATDGNDILFAEGDLAAGLDGDDMIFGAGGTDFLYGNQGNDFLYGQNGDDNLEGGIDNDLLRGDDDNDILNGGQGSDTLAGGSGIDVAVYLTGSDGVINGGVDIFLNSDFDSDQAGIEGDRVFFASEEDGSVDTLVSIERIVGSNESDTVYLQGNFSQIVDILGGSSREVQIDGQENIDIVTLPDDTTPGLDTIDISGLTARVQVDLASATGGPGQIASGGTSITIDNFEAVVGSAQGDILNGNDEANLFEGGKGADIIDGRDGVDLVYFDGSLGGVTVDLAAGTGSRGEAAGDRYTNIEGAVGTDHNDVFIASGAGIQYFAGGAGNDTFHLDEHWSENNVAVIWGGAGQDTITGTDEGIVAVTVEGLTEDNFHLFDVAELGFSDAQLAAIDAIVLNPEASDIFKSKDRPDSGSVPEYTIKTGTQSYTYTIEYTPWINIIADPNDEDEGNTILEAAPPEIAFSNTRTVSVATKTGDDDRAQVGVINTDLFGDVFATMGGSCHFKSAESGSGGSLVTYTEELYYDGALQSSSTAKFYVALRYWNHDSVWDPIEMEVIREYSASFSGAASANNSTPRDWFVVGGVFSGTSLIADGSYTVTMPDIETGFSSTANLTFATNSTNSSSSSVASTMAQLDQGNDAFIFAESNADDAIDLSGLPGIDNYQDLMTNHVSETAEGVAVDDLAGTTLMLEGLTLEDLKESDFAFA